MESNGAHAKDRKSESDAKSKDNTPSTAANTPTDNANKSPRKRRKVNHACVYCRRSHMTCDLGRPCTRCIKRNIGHLCHDEPRDPDAKKPKGSTPAAGAARDEPDSQSELSRNSIDRGTNALVPPSFDANGSQGTKPAFGPLVQGNPGSNSNQLQLVSPSPVSGLQAGTAGGNNMNQCAFSSSPFTNHLYRRLTSQWPVSRTHG
ncbi:hypothetical protein F4808DRAFT_232642 [Astrocystis sublimbata]|nr:hypothetical protein F4808DRAFT_232642 [Astrocystis sublimbata]